MMMDAQIAILILTILAVELLVIVNRNVVILFWILVNNVILVNCLLMVASIVN